MHWLLTDVHRKSYSAMSPESTLPSTRSKILFISSLPLQAQLTGPAIRCLELARQVSRVADVTITAQRVIERNTPGLAQQPFTTASDLMALVQAHDAIVTQGWITPIFPELLLTDRVKIFDLYDPLNLEALEHIRHASLDQRWREYRNVQAALHGQLTTGDFFLCANERQRDYYLGMLAAAGRLNPVTYDVADRDMRQLLAVVPMGLNAERPVHTRSVLRGVHAAIHPDDLVLIWGGSLLDWLDPLTLIRAMARVGKTRSDVKLFFLASWNPVLKDTHSITTRAIELSRELGLLDRTVIFNHEWVAYDERANYLLEADIGVTTHLDHLETRFSFRTRVLDYLWAGLPLISSAGDTFSDLIQQHQLGFTVPPGDVAALAQAILKLANDADLRRGCAANVQRVAAAFHWEKVAQPLVDFCREPRPAIDRDLDRAGLQLDRTEAAPVPILTEQIITELRQLRRSPAARISAQLKTTAKRLLRRRYTNVLFDRPIEAEGVLLPGQRRGQLFRAYASNLTGINVLVGTFGRANTCDVVLHVCDSPVATTDLAVSRLNALLMRDCDYCTFYFPPLTNSAGRELYFWLEAPDAMLSDGIAMFRYTENGELVFTQQYA
jgi:glycosyltransferase involved in cell wall biosynthesis